MPANNMNINTAMRMRTIIIRIISVIFLGSAYQACAQETGPQQWEEMVAKFEKWDKVTPPPQGANLFVGSSSITIWNVADYFPEYKVLNRGFGGSQLSDLLYYVDRVVIPYKPAKIFIYEGDNDIAAGEDPKAILKEAKKIRKLIAKKLPGVPVVFISIKPSVARWKFKTQYETLNAGFKKYAKRARHTEYADVWSPMLDQTGNVLIHVFREDGLHMNDAGYKIWQSALMPYLVK
jgi:lysophospholipase L1-like esterase